MTKVREQSFDLHPVLEDSSPVPLHFQLSESVMRELRQRTAAPGAVLPSILTLAGELALNRDTVRKAYLWLESEKVIARRPGGRIFEVTGEFARSAAQQSLTAVGIVLPDRMESLIASRATQAIEVVAGIMDGAADLGFAAMVVPLPERDDELSRLDGWLNRMLSKLNGLIYLGESAWHCHDRAFELLLDKKSIPQVVVSGRERFRDHLGLVQVDMRCGCEAAAEYLRSLGRSRIAVFGRDVPNRRFFPLQTYDRMPELLRAVNGGVPEKWQIKSRPSTSIVAEARAVLSAADRPDAVLCSEYALACDVRQAARELGIGMIDELSVVYYDAPRGDREFANIRHPYLQTGRAAVEMIAESRRKSLPVNQLDRTLKSIFQLPDNHGE